MHRWAATFALSLIPACWLGEGSGIRNPEIEANAAYVFCCDEPPETVTQIRVSHADEVSIEPSDVYCLRDSDGSLVDRMTVLSSSTLIDIVAKQCVDGPQQVTVVAETSVVRDEAVIVIRNDCPPDSNAPSPADVTALTDSPARSGRVVSIGDGQPLAGSWDVVLDGRKAIVGPDGDFAFVHGGFEDDHGWVLAAGVRVPFLTRSGPLGREDVGPVFAFRESQTVTVTIDLPAGSTTTDREFSAAGADGSSLTIPAGTAVSGVAPGGSFDLGFVWFPPWQVNVDLPRNEVALAAGQIVVPEGVELASAGPNFGGTIVFDPPGDPTLAGLRWREYDPGFGAWNLRSSYNLSADAGELTAQGAADRAKVFAVTVFHVQESTLSGLVTNLAGAPVPDVEVRADSGARARTGEDGRWSFLYRQPQFDVTDFRVGVHFLPPSAGGLSPDSVFVEADDLVLSGVTPVGTIRLDGDEIGSAHIEVRDNGARVDGATVTLVPQDGQAAPAPQATGESGEVYFNELAPGDWTADVLFDGETEPRAYSFSVFSGTMAPVRCQRVAGAGTEDVDLVFLRDDDHNPETPPVPASNLKLKAYLADGSELRGWTNRLGAARFENMTSADRLLAVERAEINDAFVRVGTMYEMPEFRNRTFVGLVSHPPADFGPDAVDAVVTAEVRNDIDAEDLEVHVRREGDGLAPLGPQTLPPDGIFTAGVDARFDYTLIFYSPDGPPGGDGRARVAVAEGVEPGGTAVLDRAADFVTLDRDVEMNESGLPSDIFRDIVIGTGTTSLRIRVDAGILSMPRPAAPLPRFWVSTTAVFNDGSTVTMGRSGRSTATEFAPAARGAPPAYAVEEDEGEARIRFVSGPPGDYVATVEFSDGSVLKGLATSSALGEELVIRFPKRFVSEGAVVRREQLVCGEVVRSDEPNRQISLETTLVEMLWGRGGHAEPRWLGLPDFLWADVDAANPQADPFAVRAEWFTGFEAALRERRSPASFLDALRYEDRSEPDDYVLMYTREG